MITTNPTKALDKPFSEVIYSTNELILTQCYKETVSNRDLEHSLIQGSTVKVVSSYDTSYQAFGLITKINNSSLDHVHKPSALGLSSKELEHLQPQVYDLLRKEVEIYLFAYKNNKGEIIKSIPPQALLVHDFVYWTNKEEILELTNELSTLTYLLKKNNLKPDILIELVKAGYFLRSNSYDYLLKVSREISVAYSDDIESLMPALKSLSLVKKN